MILTRTVTRSWRITRLYYFQTRPLYFRIVRAVPSKKLQNSLLMIYAPLSLLGLIILWGVLLVIGFAMANTGFQIAHREGVFTFADSLYYSGVTFLTLGYGDLAPTSDFGRLLAVIEAGTGFVFLASVIGYLPVIYGSIQRREILITLLDSKASSDPTGFELIRRHAKGGALSLLPGLLEKYEQWGSELLEAALSYPIVAFYRSQHDDQNWLRTSTAIMDACALIISNTEADSPECKVLRFQAKATFASLRHMIVDTAYIFNMPPTTGWRNRLDQHDFDWMMDELETVDFPLNRDFEALQKLRELYEPYVMTISEVLMFPISPWRRRKIELDNWQTAAWDDGEHMRPDASTTESG